MSEQWIMENSRPEMMDIAGLDTADRTWAVSWPSERTDKKFEASVRTLGVVRPVWALENGGRLIVADGYRRLATARAAGIDKVPVAILDNRIQLEKILLGRCCNVAGRLTPVEAARLAFKLSDKFDIDKETLVKKFLPLWGLGGSASVLNKLRELDHLQEPVARWCVENGVGLREAGLWTRFTREGQRAMLVVARTFKPGGNLLRSYLELTGEISVRENVSVEAILDDSRIRALLLDPHAAASGGRETVHRILLERRHPTLTDLQARLDNLREELGLKGAVTVEPPHLFEGSRYRAAFEFGSASELEQTAKLLLDAARSGKTGGLFRLLGAPDKSGKERQ